MTNVFQEVVTRLLEVGFYDLLIFIIALAVFYAILRKVKIVGESPMVNAALAFCIAFLVFGFPVMMGFSLVLPFVTFFTQSFIWILMFFIGVLIASFFYPDLPKFLIDKFSNSKTMIMVGILIALLVLLISGLVGAIFAVAPGEGGIAIPMDTIVIIAGVIIFVVMIIIASAVATSK